MSDETVTAESGVAAMVGVTPDVPRKEHWKVRQKREREAAAACAPTEPEKQAISGSGGFLSWDEFCNRVAVDLVTSQFGFQMLTNYTGDEAAQVFHARMKLAYTSMANAHARGPA